MSDQKHTPGPWVACDSPRNQAVIVCQKSMREGHYQGVIAELEYDDCNKADIARVRSDARLIAAAPDLLEALRLLVADVAGYSAWERPCMALDKARAAIAKATERTP